MSRFFQASVNGPIFQIADLHLQWNNFLRVFRKLEFTRVKMKNFHKVPVTTRTRKKIKAAWGTLRGPRRRMTSRAIRTGTLEIVKAIVTEKKVTMVLRVVWWPLSDSWGPLCAPVPVTWLLEVAPLSLLVGTSADVDGTFDEVGMLFIG